MDPQEPATTAAPANDESLFQFVHGVIRFLVIVRYRKHLVLATMAAAALLGGLYYATAPRLYASKASMLVMYTSPEMLLPSVAGNGMIQSTCTPTFESLITTTKVLEEAVPHLQPGDCLDLAGAPRSSWPSIIQGGLSAHAVRNTNIINIDYRSRDPNGGVAVLNAIVQSYVEFLDKTNKGTAGEIIRVLTKEKTDLAERLVRKEQEKLDTMQQLGDLAICKDGNTAAPSVQKVTAFNESLIQAQKKRIELDASLAAIEAAVRHGDDLLEYVMNGADPVGKEILFRTLGLDAQDANVFATIEHGLLDDRAALRALQAHLGPAHPEVVAKLEKIQISEQYMVQYRERIQKQVAEIKNSQVAPMLLRMLKQRASEARQLEAGLRIEFEHARSEAINLNGQLAHLEIIEHDLKWLYSLHEAMSNRITSMNVKQEGPEIRTAVVEEPKSGGSPVSPNLATVVAIVLASGLGTGLALVCLLDVLDDRFRSLDELQTQLGLPVLTIIRQLESGGVAGLDGIHTNVAPNSTESESFRTLRTALALADHETRRMVVSSAEPGDGKTTTIANLAVCYAQAEKKTLLIDADLRRPGLTALLGMRGVEGLSRVLRGDEEVADMAVACIRNAGIAGLDVLPSGARIANPTELLAGLRFSELLAWAETVYDQVLVDCPPTLVTSDVAVIGRLTDGVILVVQPEKNRRRQVLRSVETLVGLKVPLMGIVVNRVSSDDDRGYYGYSSGYGYGYGYNYYGYHTEDGDPVQDGAGQAEKAADPGAVEIHDMAGAERGSGLVPRRAA